MQWAMLSTVFGGNLISHQWKVEKWDNERYVLKNARTDLYISGPFSPEHGDIVNAFSDPGEPFVIRESAAKGAYR
jgi:hypothetical protein